MYYPGNSHLSQYKDEPRVMQLRQDNLQLQKALKQLNECYQEKVSLLEDELKESKRREEGLLEWKSNYIQRELFNNSRYEKEVQKLVSMMEEMAQNYEKDTTGFKRAIEQKEQEIAHLKDQNAYLRQEKQAQQQKVQSLAQKYIVEIERLNNQLNELKDQLEYPEDDQPSASHCLQPGDFEVISHLDGTSNFSIQGEFEGPFNQEEVQQQQLTQKQISQQNELNEQKNDDQITPQSNPLRDISNKNSATAQPGEKVTFLHETIIIQSQLIA